MNEEKKIKQLRTTIIVMAILCIIMCILFLFAFKDGNKCISNPFTYGANRIVNDDTGNLICQCSFMNLKYAPFFFDKNNVSMVRK